MKRILVFSLLSCALLAACTPSRRTTARSAPFPRDVESVPSELPPIPEVPTTGVESAPAPTPAAPAATPVPRKRDASYGVPEPGKPGFMRSPSHPEAGLIDYRGLPPGTEVKDPYTPGKIILVP